jgi:hypothetical protein
MTNNGKKLKTRRERKTLMNSTARNDKPNIIFDKFAN